MTYSISELRKICQEPREDESYRFSAFERYILRKVSIYITMFAYKIGLTANVVSVFNLALAISFGISFGLGELHFSLIGCLLAYLFCILDCVDGELARLTGTAGGSGIVLEKLEIMIFFTSVIAGVGFGATRADGNSWHIIAAFVCIASAWSWHEVIKVSQDSSTAPESKAYLVPAKNYILKIRLITNSIFSSPGIIHSLLLLFLGRFICLRYTTGATTTQFQQLILQTEWTGIYIWLQAVLHVAALINKTRGVMLGFNRGGRSKEATGV